MEFRRRLGSPTGAKLKEMNMRKYAIYIRVSTARQGASGLGLESQLESCERYIHSVGGEVSEVFKDIESGKSRSRQGLWSAIDYCKTNQQTLVIAKLDRLSRDVEFTFKVINTGIDIYFVDMPVVNTMILGVFASIAQYERELISSRTKSALRAKKERGESTGGDPEVWGKQKYADEEDRTIARTDAITRMVTAAAEARTDKARNNANNIELWKAIELWEAKFGAIKLGRSKDATDFEKMAKWANGRGLKTSTGCAFNKASIRMSVIRCKKIFGSNEFVC